MSDQNVAEMKTEVSENVSDSSDDSVYVDHLTPEERQRRTERNRRYFEAALIQLRSLGQETGTDEEEYAKWGWLDPGTTDEEDSEDEEDEDSDEEDYSDEEDESEVPTEHESHDQNDESEEESEEDSESEEDESCDPPTVSDDDDSITGIVQSNKRPRYY